MDRFTITSAIEAAAAAKGWKVIIGPPSHQNYAANQETYTPNDLVLGIPPFITNISRSNQAFNEISYRGVLLLGRKFEDTTTANLDETYIQKYTNRLKELIPLLANFALEFACGNELEHSGEIADEIDKFDTDIDFVGGLFTFYD